MIRWIAFDDETADAIVSRFRRGAAEIHDGNPLDEALASEHPSILLLPSSTPGRVLMARIQPRPQVEGFLQEDFIEEDTNEPAFEPAGFLGLRDEPVFTRRPPRSQPEPKKKWWQRFRAA